LSSGRIFMSDAFEKMWKWLAYFKVLEGLRKATKNLGQGRESLGWDSNLGPPKFGNIVLITSVTFIVLLRGNKLWAWQLWGKCIKQKFSKAVFGTFIMFRVSVNEIDCKCTASEWFLFTFSTWSFYNRSEYHICTQNWS